MVYDSVLILLNLFDFDMILNDNVTLTDFKCTKINCYYIHQQEV